MKKEIILAVFIIFFFVQSSYVASQFKQTDFYPADNIYTIYSVSFGNSPMVSIINATKTDNLTEATQNGFIDIQNPQSAIISVNYTHTNPYLLENVWSETKNASQSYTYAYASYINTTTRRYVTGIWKNMTTPGYIDPRNVQINDTLDIQGSAYNVTNIGPITLSTNITREAIWVNTMLVPNVVKTWYDSETGILLKLEFNLTYTSPYSANLNFKPSSKTSETGLKIQELTATNAFSMTQTSKSTDTTTSKTSKTADAPILSIFIGLVSIMIYKKKNT